MRQSQRFAKQAIEHHEAENNRDREAARTRIEGYRSIIAEAETGRKEDHDVLDAEMTARRELINRRADLMIGHMNAAITKDEALIRDLDGKKVLTLVEGTVDKQASV